MSTGIIASFSVLIKNKHFLLGEKTQDELYNFHIIPTFHYFSILGTGHIYI